MDNQLLLMCKNKLCAGKRNGMSTLSKLKSTCSDIADRYTWATQYNCHICHASYFQCSKCDSDKLGNVMITKSRLPRHNSLHHKYENTCSVTNDLKRKYDDTTNIGGGFTGNISENSFDRIETYNYYSFNELKGDGAAFLVSNALCGTSNAYEFMETDDITLHLLMAKFVKTLSRLQRVEFALIMEMLNDQYEGNSTNCTKSATKSDAVKKKSLHTFIPNSDAQLRKRYISGERSIVKNLPLPNIQLIDNHSYVSIRQCIANFLASGKMPHKINTSKTNGVRCITESKMAKYVLDRAQKANSNVLPENIVTLLALQWSDAFDPNSSIKSNRGAVWIKTVTFISETYNENRRNDTIPIAIGLKSESHDIVERYFVEEIKELSSGINNNFYCARLKKNICVHFEIIASLGDQPERRELNYLSGGNSKFGPRYLWSANVSSMSKYLPPCHKCFETLKNETSLLNKEHICEKCLMWDTSELCMMTEYDPPLDYPKDLIYDNSKLTPFELSFEILNRVIQLASNKYENGLWSEKELRSYTSLHGINKLGSTKIIEHCDNKMAYKVYENNVTNADGKLVMCDYAKYPDKYSHWKGGPFWNSNLQLFQFVDVLMHLLFLGVTKSTKNLIYDWITQTKRINGYNLFANNIFSEISGMGLEWCKLLVAKSGWVSDNYIAFARICKWFYYPIVFLQQNEVYHEPTQPLKKWYVKMCKEWLTAYGYDTNGTVVVLRERIEAIKKDPLTSNTLIEQTCGSGEEICHMVGSMLSMIASIMRKEVFEESVDQIEREIKIYLSYFDIVQDKRNNQFKKKSSTKTKPSWMTKYNYLSLLNIPTSIKLYGPMINLWEGSNQGEGYLRFAKPKLNNIHSKNWQQNAHLEILTEMSFEEVIEDHVNHNLVTGRCSKMQNLTNSRMEREKKMYVKYKSVNEILSLYRRNRPMSAVKCCDDKFYAVVQNAQKKLHAVLIQLCQMKSISCLSMNYHVTNLDLSLTDFDLLPFEDKMITNYILLLPELSKIGYFHLQKNASYYVIDSEWNELDKANNFMPPKSPECKY